MAERITNFSDLGKHFGDEKPLNREEQERRPNRGSEGGRQSRGRFYGNGEQTQQIKKLEKIEDPDYVARAMKVMRAIGDKDKRFEGLDGFEYRHKFELTTSKLRNILTLFNRIYNDVIMSKDAKLPQNIQDDIRHLKVRMLYEAGRDRESGKYGPVEKFLDASGLPDEVEGVGDSREKFMELAKYMEALVAYHSYFGGKD